MSANYYVAGDWNVMCDRCNKKRRRSQTRFTYDGWLVCANRCWEPRHPQDFVRGVKDRQNVPVTRPEAPDHFLEYGDVTPEDL